MSKKIVKNVVEKPAVVTPAAPEQEAAKLPQDAANLDSLSQNESPVTVLQESANDPADMDAKCYIVDGYRIKPPRVEGDRWTVQQRGCNNRWETAITAATEEFALEWVKSRSGSPRTGVKVNVATPAATPAKMEKFFVRAPGYQSEPIMAYDESCCYRAWLFRTSLEEAAKTVVPVSMASASKMEALRNSANGRFNAAAYVGAYKVNQQAQTGRKMEV